MNGQLLTPLRGEEYADDVVVRRRFPPASPPSDALSHRRNSPNCFVLHAARDLARDLPVRRCRVGGSVTMASLEHEAIVELLRNRPELALELLECLRPGDVELMRLHGAAVHVESTDFGDAKPLERAVDFVASFGTDALGVRVIVEMQLSPDPGKRLSWPSYVAASWSRSARRTFLVVLTIDEAMARWAAEPIDVGQYVFRPLVVGPAELPTIVDLDAARRSPELAVLSAAAHRNDPEILAVANAALAAVSELDEVRARFYSEFVLHWLPQRARAILEAQMDIKNEFVSEFSRQLQAKGEARGLAMGEARGVAMGEIRGEAKALLRVLASRGIPVSDAVAERIRNCADPAMLDVWLDRAAHVTTVDALFD